MFHPFDSHPRLARWALPALLALWAAPATAQVSDGALAEELFRQGQGLMAEERYDEACAKLAESQRLDPSTGTLLNLAVCHEKQGKLATAWNEFNEALAAARRDGREDRVAYAQERITAIEPNLSRLTIELPAEHDVPGLEVEVDRVAVGRPALGVALPIDPGVHTVVVSAPGKRPWRAEVDIAEGPAAQSVAIPRLVDAPAEGGAVAATSSTVDTSEAPSDGSTQRYVAYGLGGLGLVGVGLGAFWGLDAKSKLDESNERGCNGNDCTPAGAELRNSARDAGTLSTVAFAVGAAALGAGVILYFTAPSTPPDAAADVSTRPGGWQARFRGTAQGATAELVTTW